MSEDENERWQKRAAELRDKHSDAAWRRRAKRIRDKVKHMKKVRRARRNAHFRPKFRTP